MTFSDGRAQCTPLSKPLIGMKPSPLDPVDCKRNMLQQERSRLWFLCFGLCCALALMGGCSGSNEPTRRAELEAEFQDEFGFEPTLSIKDIHCKVLHVGDTWAKWMRFDYETTAFQRITNQNFFTAPPEVLRNPWKALWSQDLQTTNRNSPAWWPNPPLPEGTMVFYKEGQVTNFNRSYIYLWVDAPKSRIYVKSAAWE